MMSEGNNSLLPVNVVINFVEFINESSRYFQSPYFTTVARSTCSHLIYKPEADRVLILLPPLSRHQCSVFGVFKATLINVRFYTEKAFFCWHKSLNNWSLNLKQCQVQTKYTSLLFYSSGSVIKLKIFFACSCQHHFWNLWPVCFILTYPFKSCRWIYNLGLKNFTVLLQSS